MIKMPRQPFELDSGGWLTPPWHLYFEQIERASAVLDSNATDLEGLNTAVAELPVGDDGLPEFGTLASVNHQVLTQAEYDALGTYDANTIYFIEET
ncbi:MAG: hypothetical protein WAT93_07360 [Pontixanthobacter sp.]